MQVNDMSDNCSPDTIQQYKQEISEWWTKDCKFYDNYPEHGLTKKEEELWQKFLLHELGESPKRILDVGTGTGSISLILSALGHDVSGVDLSPGMLSVCERKAVERGLSLDLKVGDAEALPYPDNSFDVITSRWVLWTLLQPSVAIQEWKRVLRPGGRILAFDVKTHDNLNQSVSQTIKGHISKFLISVQDGRKLDSYLYKSDINMALPLAYNKQDCFNRQVMLFKDANLDDVSAKPVEPLSVMKNEKLNKPWRYRFAKKGYGDWHCISGMKKQ